MCTQYHTPVLSVRSAEWTPSGVLLVDVAANLLGVVRHQVLLQAADGLQRLLADVAPGGRQRNHGHLAHKELLAAVVVVRIVVVVAVRIGFGVGALSEEHGHAGDVVLLPNEVQVQVEGDLLLLGGRRREEGEVSFVLVVLVRHPVGVVVGVVVVALAGKGRPGVAVVLVQLLEVLRADVLLQLLVVHGKVVQHLVPGNETMQFIVQNYNKNQ